MLNYDLKLTSNKRYFFIRYFLIGFFLFGASIPTHAAAAAEGDDLDDRYAIFKSRGYLRPLVTRFLVSFPGTQKDLAAECDVSQGTISKLKTPHKYTPMNTSAEKVWVVVEKGLVFLRETFDLDEEITREMVTNLLTIDLSGANIVSDDIKEDDPSTPGKLLSSVVEELRIMSGTFTTLKLSNNFLTDDGIDGLIEFLTTQPQLECFECQSSGLGDKGIKKFIDLLKRDGALPKLIILDLSGNYGPSAEIRDPIDDLAEELREKLKIEPLEEDAEN